MIRPLDYRPDKATRRRVGYQSRAPLTRRLLAATARGEPRRSSPRFAERHQAALRLVPQRQTHAAKAFEQRHPANRAKFRMVAKHLRQPVIGDAAAEVMDVVHADIGREPAQQGGQIVMRTAVQRCLV